MHHGFFTAHGSALVLAAVAVSGAVLLAGCQAGTKRHQAQATIDSATFIATYVDLRLAVLEPEPGQMNDSVRSAILARHGVTEQQLKDFARVHGSNVAYMRSVWNQVENGIRQTHVGTKAAPSTGAPTKPSVPEARRQSNSKGQRIPPPQ